MEYVTYNETGKLTGSYSQELQFEHEVCYIEVTADQRQGWTAYKANIGRDGLETAGPIPSPTPFIPEFVTMRQARLALLAAGLLANVDTAIDSLPSPTKEAARIEWDYSSTVERHRGLVQSLGATMGLTDAQLDALFIQAATL